MGILNTDPVLTDAQQAIKAVDGCMSRIARETENEILEINKQVAKVGKAAVATAAGAKASQFLAVYNAMRDLVEAATGTAPEPYVGHPDYVAPEEEPE